MHIVSTVHEKMCIQMHAFSLPQYNLSNKQQWLYTSYSCGPFQSSNYTGNIWSKDLFLFETWFFPKRIPFLRNSNFALRRYGNKINIVI